MLLVPRVYLWLKPSPSGFVGIEAWSDETLVGAS